ncbi:hypothetical protein ACGFRB_26840 [Streptomyces sp. NPDC048718]|uniref:hypothetical protein n=1 Tax=Streptomyces sp. NPDC048718 TaxID=3365587 RepID=UPI003712BFA0
MHAVKRTVAALSLALPLLIGCSGLAAADTVVSSGSTTTAGPGGVSTTSGTRLYSSTGAGFTVMETTNTTVIGIAGVQTSNSTNLAIFQ